VCFVRILRHTTKDDTLSRTCKFRIVVSSMGLWILATGFASSHWHGCTTTDVLNRGTALYLTVMLGLALVTCGCHRESWGRTFGFVGLVAIGVSVAGYTLASNATGAFDRSRQKRTMADMRTISDRIEKYLELHPGTGLPSEFPALRETLGKRTPMLDGWGNEFKFFVQEGGYMLVSFGALRKKLIRVISAREMTKRELRRYRS